MNSLALAPQLLHEVPPDLPEPFVADPIRFEIRRAVTSVVQPREPMTLFFVHGRGDAPPAGEALLLAAIDGFHSQRPPAP